MSRVVFLNGPPRCGKDTAGRLLSEAWPGRCRVDKFARQLKEAVHAAYGLIDNIGLPWPHDHFETVKDEPRDEFFERTPRAVYIAFSEQFLKPLHGPAVFGEMLLRDLRGFSPTLVAITDSGFREEAVPLVVEYGAESCTLVRIHREGCSFAGDSRSYLDLADLGVACRDVVNPGTTTAAFLDVLRRALPEIL